jgi:MoxR-like ATPase
MTNNIENAVTYIESLLYGQRNVVEMSLACIVSSGHLLLEGPPGVGKTTLARGLSEVFSGEFHRVQMTSDLLPSDIIGFMRPSADGRELEFRKGPVFCNFLLADELNRSNPKTQSALLEAMAEAHVSIDGQKYSLPEPFYVIATQNPLESHGVFPLAESELDRFTMLLEVDLPSDTEEMKIYLRHLNSPNEKTVTSKKSLLTLAELEDLRVKARKSFIEDSVFQYFYKIVSATRAHSEVSAGVSVRGAIHFMSCAQSLSLVRGREYVIPQDLRDLAISVLAHRISLIREGASFGEKKIVIEEVMDQIQPPR